LTGPTLYGPDVAKVMQIINETKNEFKKQLQVNRNGSLSTGTMQRAKTICLYVYIYILFAHLNRSAYKFNGQQTKKKQPHRTSRCGLRNRDENMLKLNMLLFYFFCSAFHNSVDPVVIHSTILAKLKEMYNKINYTLYTVCVYFDGSYL
jgi:hypothetical protein